MEKHNLVPISEEDLGVYGLHVCFVDREVEPEPAVRVGTLRGWKEEDGVAKVLIKWTEGHYLRHTWVSADEVYLYYPSQKEPPSSLPKTITAYGRIWDVLQRLDDGYLVKTTCIQTPPSAVSYVPVKDIEVDKS